MKSFSKNDWAHIHDCILHITWKTTQKKSTQEELEQIFLSLPEDLQEEAFEWGMSDTCWRDSFIEYYQDKV